MSSLSKSCVRSARISGVWTKRNGFKKATEFEKVAAATFLSFHSVCLSLCSRAANAATRKSQMVFIRSGVRTAGAGGFSTI